MSVNPKVIETPRVSAVALDGIQLHAVARITVRASIQKLVGGAGEETVVARVGEGIVSSIGGAKSHKDVLENPNMISQKVLASGLDAGTAFEILSIDIADVDVGEFAVLEVKDVNEVGAFLDWGLDKDLFLPYKQQLGKLLPGDRCVVYILEDERTARIVATEKIKAFIDRDTRDLHISQKVDLAVYDVAEDYVDFLVNYRYTGRLHLNSFIQDTFEIGDCGVGYIQNIREDGGLSISLKPVGYHATMDAADDIIQKLEEAGGSLPYSDNSSPEEIQQEFGVSKKAFKKIIGGLFRQGRIFIGNDGIRLAPKKENRRFSHQKPRKNFRKHP